MVVNLRVTVSLASALVLLNRCIKPVKTSA